MKFALPEEGIFEIEITPDSISHYERVWKEDSYSKRKLDAKSPVIVALNRLSNIPFSRYLIGCMERGELPAYLDCLGVLEKELLQEDIRAKVKGMILWVPKDETKLSIIATRSEDIKSLEPFDPDERYLKLGSKEIEKDEDYERTSKLAEDMFGVHRYTLEEAFSTSDPLFIFDFFVPSKKYHTYIFDTSGKLKELEREPGKHYGKCLGDLLRDI